MVPYGEVHHRNGHDLRLYSICDYALLDMRSLAWTIL